MLKNSYLIVIFYLFSSLYIIAQDTERDFPDAGTNLILAKANLYPGIKLNIRDLGNETWDLSAYLPQAFDTIRLKEPLKTRYGRRFPDASIAVVSSPVQVEYLVIDSGRVYLTGLIDDFMEKKLPVLLRFKDKLLYKNHHLLLNEQYSDTSETTFLSPYYIHPATDSIRADISYIRSGRIDASGQLITPLGKFNAEREVIFIEKIVKGYKYSVFGWTPAPEYSLNKHYTFYRWYSKESKLPIAEAYLNEDDFIEFIRYQYDSPLRLSFTGEDVKCKGGNDGSVQMNVIGGIPDYTFKWSTGDSTSELTNQKAGTYNIEVTDNRGRKISTFYTVAEPLYELKANFNVKHVSCRGLKDGRLGLNITGGKAPYDFKWSNDSIKETMTNLAPSWIKVWISDAGGCTITDSIEIKEPDEKLSILSEEKNVACFHGNDGTVLLNCRGGTTPYHFQWADGDTSRYRIGLKAGQYQVTASDKNNCNAKTIVTIKEPDSPLKTSKNIKPVSCFGGSDGSIELNASGGKAPYEYTWADSTYSKSLKGIPSGSYHYTVTDKFGCSLIDSAFVSQPSSPLSIRTFKKDVNCFGESTGEIKAEVSGGTGEYNYLWSNGSNKPELNKLKPGIYIVKVQDKNQCFISDSVEISAPENPLYAEIEKSDVKCKNGNDGEIKVSVNGGTPGYTYMWSNKSTEKDLIGIKAGNYNLIISDKNNCQLKKDVVISQPDEAIEITAKKTDVDCYGAKTGTIYLDVKGGKPGYDFEWSDGSNVPNLLGLRAGKYTATITDNVKCVSTKIVEILEPGKISIKTEVVKPEKDKENGSIKVEISGGTKPYQILWDNGQNTNIIQNLRPGSYEIQVTDAKNCRVSNVIELSE